MPPGWSECWVQGQMADGKRTAEEAEAEEKAGFSTFGLGHKQPCREEQPCFR